MKRRVVAALLLLPMVGLPALTSSRYLAHGAGLYGCTVNGELFAVPQEGHSGDTIYLSGGCLQPNTEYEFPMGCPSATDPTAINNHDVLLMTRPGTNDTATATTDANGQFSAVAVQAIQLNGFSPPWPCTIYTADQKNPWGPELPARFVILPPHGVRPQACRDYICAKLSFAPPQAHAGGTENISIQGWSGATVTVTVVYRGKPPTQVKRTVTLDWKGAGRIRMPVPVSAAHLSCKRVWIGTDVSLGHARVGTRFHRVRTPGPSSPCFSVAS